VNLRKHDLEIALIVIEDSLGALSNKKAKSEVLTIWKTKLASPEVLPMKEAVGLEEGLKMKGNL